MIKKFFTSPYLLKFINIVMVFVVLLDIFALILSSVEAVYKEYQYYFDLLEQIVVYLFTIEYLIRIYVSSGNKKGEIKRPIKDRLDYIFSPLGIIDLLSILPHYLNLTDARVFLLKLVRVLKLTRYSKSMKLILTVLKQEMKTFLAALTILFVVAIFSSAIVYFFENPHQPEAFSSIPQTMYWSLITLTTVGYGDITPITIIGKFFSVIVALSAIIITALPAGILASAISDQIRRTREEYEQKVETMLRDGHLTAKERSDLEKAGEALGLRDEDASHIIESSVQINRALSSCPHCGKPISSGRRRPQSRTSNRR